MRLRRLLVLTSIQLVLLAGCQGDDEGEQRAPPVRDGLGQQERPPGGEEARTLGATCVNLTLGFEVDYPEQWWTNSARVLEERCRYFHPTPVLLEWGTEPPPVAVRIDEERVPLERIRSSFQEGPAERLLSLEETRIDGYHTLVVETEATEEAPLKPPGTRTYQYLIRLDDEVTLVAATSSSGGIDYEESKRILDQMIRSLEFH